MSTELPAALQLAIKLWPLVLGIGAILSAATGFLTGYAVLRKEVQSVKDAVAEAKGHAAKAMEAATKAMEANIKNTGRIIALETRQETIAEDVSYIVDTLDYIRANMILHPSAPNPPRRRS